MSKRYNLAELTFLVIDDNSYMLSIIKTILKSLGVQNIREANDAADAFEEFQASPIDVIILDYALQTLDGIEFCQLVRQAKDSPNPYVPIIMLTAYTERIRIIEARDAGITEFLCKPICAKDLFNRIIETIERPRPFVRSSAYFGPDRRRHDPDAFRGNEQRKDRKKTDADDNPEAPSEEDEEQVA